MATSVMTVTVPIPADVMAAELGGAALLWAKAGWLVFPIVPRGKTPFAAGDFCGREDDHACGFHCATGDEEQIDAWWDQHPDSNIGLSAPDAFVVDEDRVSALREAGIHLPVCPWQVTGRAAGGKHFFLAAPGRWAGLQPGARVRNRLEGVEVKGFNKGYVVAAPSIHATGSRYTLQMGGYVPECPTDVANALTEITLPEGGTGATLTTITAGGYVLPARVPSGDRYAEMLRYSAHLYNRGLSREEMWSLVEGQLAPRFDPPLGRTELRERFGRATAAMAERLGEPRSLPTGEAGGRPTEDAPELLPPVALDEFPAAPDMAAFGGLIGECVMDIAPGTDASLVGLLGSLIAFAGALIPGQAYFHRLQTSSPFVALVGESAIGRKGTAMMRAHDAMAGAIEPVYVNRVILDGLNSGEALVATLDYKHTAFPYEPTVGLVFEEEYASLLASRQREGSTLDAKMRQAFDGGPISNRRSGETKTVAPPYWLPALIGITPVELRQRLDAGALQSGSANRWLYLPVVRRNVVPTNEEPALAPEHRESLAAARRVALDHAQVLRVAPEVTRTLAEYADWLAGQSVGLARDLTRRLGIIAFRVGLVHAMAERSVAVTMDHLRRALALTEYARSGIEWVFGPTVGNADARVLLRELEARGRLSRHYITQHVIRDPIRRQDAIDELARLGMARVVTVQTASRNRTELVPTGSSVQFVRYLATAPVENSENLHELHETDQTASTEPARNGTEPARNRTDSTAIWTSPCRSYSEHQSSHRQTTAGWTCDLCSPAAPA